MSRVIVTGAGGFIGRTVVDRLTASGHSVGAWTEPIDAMARSREPADAVVHLAATSRQFAADPASESAVNLAGTEAVLAFCRASGAACVFASTAGVYRADAGSPLDEDAAVGPEGAYAAGKLAAEERCRDSFNRHGVRCSILRLFNVYGPGQRPPFVIPYVVESIAAGEPLDLRMPEAIRDFVFVDDAARAFAASIDMPAESFRVVNVGSGTGTRVSEVVAAVARLLEKTPRWGRAGERFAEAPASVADIRRARAELHWEPMIFLEAGLAAVCATHLNALPR